MQDLPTLLATLRQGIERILGDQLEAMYLYGSQARGDAQPTSDIDILAIIRGEFNHLDLLETTAPITCILSLENDVVISSTFISKSRFENENSPFILNIKREGVPL